MITNLKKSLVINPHRLYNYITHLTILMKSILPQDISGQQLQTIMQTAIAPRPIAFASTVDAEGNVNLSPFSFFQYVQYQTSDYYFFHLQEG